MDRKKFNKVLRQSNLVLVRSKNHEVYRCNCPGKHTFTVAKSASDHRAIKNIIGDMKKTGCKDVQSF